MSFLQIFNTNYAIYSIKFFRDQASNGSLLHDCDPLTFILLDVVGKCLHCHETNRNRFATVSWWDSVSSWAAVSTTLRKCLEPEPK
mmetsp:Transcript_140335/g.315072  ORF Transcript_140335/g.315072 Transcript_140335/m.315072 type:complete len:86 (-) Transcript_140335:82-339(-)